MWSDTPGRASGIWGLCLAGLCVYAAIWAFGSGGPILGVFLLIPAFVFGVFSIALVDWTKW